MYWIKDNLSSGYRSFTPQLERSKMNHFGPPHFVLIFTQRTSYQGTGSSNESFEIKGCDTKRSHLILPIDLRSSSSLATNNLSFPGVCFTDVELGAIPLDE